VIEATILARCQSGHLAAFSGTSFTFVGTALAVIGIMLSALGTTCITHLGTDPTNLLSELRAAAHESGCRPADCSTIFVETDALGHRFHILLLQTTIAAMFTLLSTTNTGFDA
jgi:hypothetical protein